MSQSLYDDDLLVWSEEQAAALRALARRPELSNALDWENVIEEIESLGRADVRAVQAHLEQLLVHLLKLASSPMHRSLRHWRKEIRNFQTAVERLCTRSIANRTDMDKVWRDAVATAQADVWAHGEKLLPGLPDACPFAMADVAARDFDVDEAIGIILRSIAARN
jgi:hypothetical protein